MKNSCVHCCRCSDEWCLLLWLRPLWFVVLYRSMVALNIRVNVGSWTCLNAIYILKMGTFLIDLKADAYFVLSQISGLDRFSVWKSTYAANTGQIVRSVVQHLIQMKVTRSDTLRHIKRANKPVGLPHSHQKGQESQRRRSRATKGGAC